MIEYDLPCRSCGYLLRGLEEDSKCPECATDVAVSLAPSEISRADPLWVWGMAVGAGATAAGGLAAVAWTVLQSIWIALVLSSSPWATAERFSRLGYEFNLLGLGLILGLSALCLREPSAGLVKHSSRRILVAAVCFQIAFSGGFLVVLLRLANARGERSPLEHWPAVFAPLVLGFAALWRARALATAMEESRIRFHAASGLATVALAALLSVPPLFIALSYFSRTLVTVVLVANSVASVVMFGYIAAVFFMLARSLGRRARVSILQGVPTADVDPAVINRAIPCAKCGASLKAVALPAVCQVCETPIENILSIRNRLTADLFWTWSMRIAFMFLAAGFLLSIDQILAPALGVGDEWDFRATLRPVLTGLGKLSTGLLWAGAALACLAGSRPVEGEDKLTNSRRLLMGSLALLLWTRMVLRPALFMTSIDIDRPLQALEVIAQTALLLFIVYRALRIGTLARDPMVTRHAPLAMAAVAFSILIQFLRNDSATEGQQRFIIAVRIGAAIYAAIVLFRLVRTLGAIARTARPVWPLGMEQE